MKKIVLTFGVISGLIVVAMMFVTIPLHYNGTLDENGGLWVGYTTMVIALSMIFFGVKSYRDNNLSGFISFGAAFRVGLLICLIASFMYAIGWEIDYHFFFPDFMENYSQAVIKKAELRGASPAEMTSIIAKMEESKKMYQSPILRFGMTLMEIFPVGLLIALSCAAILKKKEPQTLTPSNT